ncbi:MAG: hypothetical protein R3C26_07655 [Calditrichia bacterium]
MNADNSFLPSGLLAEYFLIGKVTFFRFFGHERASLITLNQNNFNTQIPEPVEIVLLYIFIGNYFVHILILPITDMLLLPNFDESATRIISRAILI